MPFKWLQRDIHGPTPTVSVSWQGHTSLTSPLHSWWSRRTVWFVMLLPLPYQKRYPGSRGMGSGLETSPSRASRLCAQASASSNTRKASSARRTGGSTRWGVDHGAGLSRLRAVHVSGGGLSLGTGKTNPKHWLLPPRNTLSVPLLSERSAPFRQVTNAPRALVRGGPRPAPRPSAGGTPTLPCLPARSASAPGSGALVSPRAANELGDQWCLSALSLRFPLAK